MTTDTIEGVLRDTSQHYAGDHVNADVVLHEVRRRLRLTRDNGDDSALVVTPSMYRLMAELGVEVERQDSKHGPYQGTTLGRSRLALATLEDETREALDAWRSERKASDWQRTRAEVMQVAAVCLRTIRDALGDRP